MFEKGNNSQFNLNGSVLKIWCFYALVYACSNPICTTSSSEYNALWNCRIWRHWVLAPFKYRLYHELEKMVCISQKEVRKNGIEILFYWNTIPSLSITVKSVQFFKFNIRASYDSEIIQSNVIRCFLSSIRSVCVLKILLGQL